MLKYYCLHILSDSRPEVGTQTVFEAVPGRHQLGLQGGPAFLLLSPLLLLLLLHLLVRPDASGPQGVGGDQEPVLSGLLFWRGAEVSVDLTDPPTDLGRGAAIHSYKEHRYEYF